jgi:hypothetical protein
MQVLQRALGSISQGLGVNAIDLGRWTPKNMAAFRWGLQQGLQVRVLVAGPEALHSVGTIASLIRNKITNSFRGISLLPAVARPA